MPSEYASDSTRPRLRCTALPCQTRLILSSAAQNSSLSAEASQGTAAASRCTICSVTKTARLSCCLATRRRRLLTAIDVASAARRRSIGLRMLLAMRAIAESPRWSRSGSQM